MNKDKGGVQQAGKVPFRAVTPKMLVAEKYVDRYIDKFKVPPTYREVAKDLGLVSVNSAFVRLRRYRHKMKQQVSNKEKDFLGIIKGNAILNYPSEYDRYNWLRSAYIQGATAMQKLYKQNQTP